MAECSERLAGKRSAGREPFGPTADPVASKYQPNVARARATGRHVFRYGRAWLVGFVRTVVDLHRNWSRFGSGCSLTLLSLGAAKSRQLKPGTPARAAGNAQYFELVDEIAEYDCAIAGHDRNVVDNVFDKSRPSYTLPSCLSDGSHASASGRSLAAPYASLTRIGERSLPRASASTATPRNSMSLIWPASPRPPRAYQRNADCCGNRLRSGSNALANAFQKKTVKQSWRH